VDLSLFQMIEGLRYALPRTMAQVEMQHPRMVAARWGDEGPRTGAAARRLALNQTESSPLS
jgi:hypothetical protein